MVQSDKFVGVKTDFGELDIVPQTGQWTLKDAQSATLILESALGKINTPAPTEKDDSLPKKTATYRYKILPTLLVSLWNG